MIFPAVIIGTCGKNLKVMLVTALGTTSIAAIVGLGSSIAIERLSTVPSQIITMLIFLSLISFVTRTRRKYEQS